MAEKTVISIEVEGTGKAINSIKELKAELKAAQSAALNGDGKAAKRVAELKDKMDDLTDSTKSLQGSGVERITSGFDLLGQGFKDFDFDKIKTGFKGLGSAMSAIPIFLLIEGIMLLVQNFEEVVKFFGIGVTESDRLTAALERQKKVNEGLFSVQENAIAIMKAEGASMKDVLEATEKLNSAKIKAAKDDIELQKLKIKEVFLNDSVTESLQRTAISVLRAQGNARDADLLEAKIQQDKLKRASEFGDQIRTDLITISKLETETKLQTIDAEKKQNESLKKLQGDRLKDKAEAAKLEREQSIIDAEELFKQLSLHQDTELALRNKARKDELDAEKAAQEQQFQDGLFIEQFIKDQAAKEIEIEKTKQAHKQQIQMQALNTASQLVGLANQLAGSNKNVQKAALIAESAIGIAKIIISTRAANAAANLTPQAIATSGAAAIPVIAFNNISAALGIAASIAATTKALGALGGGSAGAAPSLGATPSAPSMPSGNGTPSIAAPQQNTTTFTGNNNNNFNQPPIKTYVVETDLRNSTNTIDKIKDQATF
jgi:hypothetical protein